jgi:hypothetical protein
MQCVITSEDLGIAFSWTFTCTIKTSKKLHSYFFSENITMENQESSAFTRIENPITTEDINMEGLIDIVDDGDGGRPKEEKSKTPESYKPSLINYRNFAYNILKYLEEKSLEI